MSQARQLYTYEDADRRTGDRRRRQDSSYGRGERVLTPRQRRMRRERMRMRRRKRKIRLLVTAAVYLVMALTVAGGLFFLGKGIQGLGKFFGFTQNEELQANAAAQGGQPIQEPGPAVKEGPLIYLDAGHGGKDQGTSYQETLEKDINLAVAKKAAKLLEEAGFQVEMTRTEDVKIDNYERAGMANRAEADVFVSIHCNYLEEGEADGIEVYHDEGKVEGGVLGRSILDRMIAQTGAKDRDVRTEDFVVTRETRMPSVLVELGYLSDYGERTKMMTDSYQNLLAKGIADGIAAYLEEK